MDPPPTSDRGAPPADAAAALLGIGSVVADRWEIVRPLARGGMASVFEARHTLSRKAVALKVLDLASAFNERHRVRFQREVSIRSEVGHEGIVDVLDAGIDAGSRRLYVAMELLAGEPLRERMDRTSPGAASEPLYRAVREMLEPLAAAHQHGVVHRDLKPDNLFLARLPDGTERVKLLDFGIAVSRDSQRATLAGVPIGTPNYMSPEQTLDAASVDARADSWSVGVMLFELATGRTPYVGASAEEIFQKTLAEPAPPVATIVPAIPPRLAALIDRCLQREPSARPDVRTIAAELDAIFPPAGGSATRGAVATPAASPAPAAAQASGSARRWGPYLGFGCFAAVSLAVVLGGLVWVLAVRPALRAAQETAATMSTAAARLSRAPVLTMPGVVTSPSKVPGDFSTIPGLTPAGQTAPLARGPDGVLTASCVSSCRFECPAGERCVGSCAPGGCTFACGEGADCQFPCAAGSCRGECAARSSCVVPCPAGGCRIQCAEGARCQCVGTGCECTGPGCR